MKAGFDGKKGGKMQHLYVQYIDRGDDGSANWLKGKNKRDC